MSALTGDGGYLAADRQLEGLKKLSKYEQWSQLVSVCVNTDFRRPKHT